MVAETGHYRSQHRADEHIAWILGNPEVIETFWQVVESVP
jgi:hypothetical protein